MLSSGKWDGLSCGTCTFRLETDNGLYCRRYPATVFERLAVVMPNIPPQYVYHSQFSPCGIPCGEYIEGDGIDTRNTKEEGNAGQVES